MKVILFQILTILTGRTAIADKYSKIIRERRIYPQRGIFSFEYETENGIIRSESGQEDLVRTGIVSYRMPNGEDFFLKFIADKNGYKPDSKFLPVPPVFPHPIPIHALRQIERGKRERAEREKRKRRTEENKKRKSSKNLFTNLKREIKDDFLEKNDFYKKIGNNVRKKNFNNFAKIGRNTNVKNKKSTKIPDVKLRKTNFNNNFKNRPSEKLKKPIIISRIKKTNDHFIPNGHFIPDFFKLPGLRSQV